MPTIVNALAIVNHFYEIEGIVENKHSIVTKAYKYAKKYPYISARELAAVIICGNDTNSVNNFSELADFIFYTEPQYTIENYDNVIVYAFA